MHGRLSGKEKDETMTDFSKGKIKLLVATSVVEVGVDTKASIMCVLAASYCFLHTTSTSERALTRLSAVVECTDGAEIAERDFEMRGAGELLGTVQSGATLTPALGLPMTPKVLAAARALGEEERGRISAYLFFLRVRSRALRRLYGKSGARHPRQLTERSYSRFFTALP